jgi:hypothetical protein
MLLANGCFFRYKVKATSGRERLSTHGKAFRPPNLFLSA